MRTFNTEGPVVPERHYCIPPLQRVNLEEVIQLLRDMRYFVLHAPRQTGKTSALLALRDLLNSRPERDFRCVYVNVEAAQALREDLPAAMQTIIGELSDRALLAGDGFLDPVWPELLARFGAGQALSAALTRWAMADPRPLVLLIDEIDSLIGDTLISVLRQLRAGYDRRPSGFPQSVVLCGVRDVRDMVTGGSAFNVKAESLRLGDFTEAQVRALLSQHTEETGQAFTPQAQAFLQRIVNSGGRIEREYGLGRGRTDLLIIWPQQERREPHAAARFVIECKVLRASLERTIREGVAQTLRYVDRCAARSGHLVVFDRTEGKPWEEKIFRRVERTGEHPPITVWGM